MAKLVSWKAEAWIEYALETKLVDPPVLKLRLKYMSPYEVMPTAKETEKIYDPKFLLELAAKAILDWDLTDEFGKKIPVEKAVDILKVIGGEAASRKKGAASRKKGEEEKKSTTLLVAIIEDIGDPDFFFSASKDSVSGTMIGDSSAIGEK